MFGIYDMLMVLKTMVQAQYMRDASMLANTAWTLEMIKAAYAEGMANGGFAVYINAEGNRYIGVVS